MRRIGSLPTTEAAERFAGHLRRQGLECRINPEADGKSIWLFDEDALEQARGELEEFRNGSLVLPPMQKPAERAPAPKADPGSARPWSWRRADWFQRVREFEWPFTFLLLAASVIATLAIDFGNQEKPWLDALGIMPFSPEARSLSESPWTYLEKGQIWRLITPILLHFGPLHLLLDVQWTYVFGGAIERVRGTWRLVGLVVFSAVLSNLGQYFWSGPTFGGLSGVGHAMFGYVWMKYRFQPQVGLVLPPTLFWLFWGFFLLCFTDIIGLPIANVAHAVGLAAGILYGIVPFL